MKKILINTLLFLGCALAADARLHNHNRKIIPSTQAVTGNFALGAIGGYATLGVGIEYEQFLKRYNSNLSVTLKANAFMGGTITFGEIDENEVRSKNYGFFVAPGMRFHPLGNEHRVDLGLGITAPLGSGNRRDMLKGSYFSSPIVETTRHDFFGAVLGEVTSNFQFSNRKALFSLFAIGGVIYSNAKVTLKDTYNDPLYLQFGLRLGGRW